MEMEEGLDTGPMLLIERIAIGEQDTTGMVHDKLAALGGKMIVEALHKMRHGQLEAVPQPEAGVTYAAKISKEEAALDFTQSAEEVHRKIRAFNPFPGAHATINGVTVKIWAADMMDDDCAAPAGEVVLADAEHGVVVACAGGRGTPLRL